MGEGGVMEIWNRTFRFQPSATRVSPGIHIKQIECTPKNFLQEGGGRRRRRKTLVLRPKHRKLYSLLDCCTRVKGRTVMFGEILVYLNGIRGD